MDPTCFGEPGLCKISPEMKTSAYHFVARCQAFLTPRKERKACVDFWWRLRRRFPKVGACVLMPNHFHILIFTPDADRTRWELGVELRAWTQRFHPGRSVWCAIPEVSPIRDHLHLRRQIRYVHLNPCRAGLATDPIQWEWSTHRDAVGCVEEAWPSREALSEAFESPLSLLGENIHRYVSKDPSVSVVGSPMVRTPRPGQPISASSSAILSASAIALRKELTIKDRTVRNLAIQVSHRLCLKPEPKSFYITQSGWNRVLRKPVSESGIQAALRVLHDPRCHMWKEKA